MKTIKRLRNNVVPFDFKPFSQKQLKVLTWWNKKSPYKDYNAIIADGSIRSGKTVSLALSYVLWAMDSYSGENFALCGKTIHACRRNVLQPLKKMLKSRGYEVQEVRNENVVYIAKTYLDPKTKKPIEIMNVFHIFGGRDESSQDLIQGITLAGVFFDEVALMPESFVSQATGRCSVKGSKYWFSCNPGNPFHWFNTEWIQKAILKGALYLHFTMDDNLSLDPAIKKRYMSQYSGVFFKRYILGLWVMADGVVYPMFDADTHCIDIDRYWTRTFIAGDFGIQNPTTFGLYGYYAPENRYHLIDRYHHNGREQGQKTTKQYADDLAEFIKSSGYKPEYIILDPSASAMSVELTKHAYFRREEIEVIPANNEVILGIQFVSLLLNKRLFTMYADAEFDKREFSAYMWDSKHRDRGEDEVVKSHDHCMDSNRYGLLTDAYINEIYEFERDNFSRDNELAYTAQVA